MNQPLGPPPSLTLVIPCYNEARRLSLPELAAFLDAAPSRCLVLVDDGSTDSTGWLLAGLAGERPGEVRVLTLSPNQGKAAAVRQGLLAALAEGPELVGYWDADLAAPLAEAAPMAAHLAARPGLEAVLAARVGLLGRDIQRNLARHYLGRAGATLISWLLDLAVYDTQCGAKLFRAGPRLARVLEQPFQARWLVDVEIILRYLAQAGPDFDPTRALVEYPLETWRDVPGSKLGPGAYPRSLADLVRLGRTYGRGGRGGRRAVVAR
ncbi:MAG: glycosyltransferase [Deltaproteobacteria bacterium]|nr:glycosyltransferase [Deltaproteobacteria bacterium]